MPQKGKKSAPQTAKTYTSESLLLRSVIGIVLIALGVLMALSVFSVMEGAVFSIMADLSRGLAGGVSIGLAALTIWAGVLTTLSSRRKMPWKPFVLAAVMYLCLLSAVNLLSRAWDSVTRTEYAMLDYIRVVNQREGLEAVPDQFLKMAVRAFTMCQNTCAGGGLLGMLLAWPLWKGVGGVFGAILSILGVLLCGFFLSRVDVRQLAANWRERSEDKRQRREEEQAQLAREQAQWQREEQMRQYQARQAAQAARQAAAQSRRQQKAQSVRQDVYQPVYAENYTENYPENYPDEYQECSEAAENEYYEKYQEPVYDDRYTPARQAGFYEETFAQDGQRNGMDWEGAMTRARKPASRRKTQECAEDKPTESLKSRQTAEPKPAVMTTDNPDFADDTPPWEGPSSMPVTAYQRPSETTVKPERTEVPKSVTRSETVPEKPMAAETRKPVLQPTTSMSGEQFDIPDVKLPPTKRREPRQMEMDLPIPYTYPSLNLLKAPAPPKAEDQGIDRIRAQKLEETLESFRIPAKVKHVTHGPAIARFELELASGINVSRVLGVDKNIAMNLEVKNVRIEAPIPGKSLVGVEVPNREISSVTLREVLESAEMRRMESPLAVALGKDIAGQPVVCDLEKMPHVLIAGATGSGKSVCINAIINSILYRATPQQVRMILIDPKMVELQCYNCVPHLLVPVVSDPHKASGALAWVVAEMMERYQKFKEHSVRNISGYNASLFDGEEQMPRIVVIIDELADLMMTCKKDVEEYICRLAQLARAAGIHLVVATQRPSVDVITGLIKANIPSRIAFTVSSSVDSRTILDRIGAEKLLGKGDMLYHPNGEMTPFRVQGCFLSDDEVNRVTDFIQRTSRVEFDPNILEKLEESAAAPMPGSAPDDAEPVDVGDGVDPLLYQAIELAVQDGQTSISMLQRRLRIGYSRAGRLVDEMTRRGILSQADGSKPRQVLITREELDELNQNAGIDG